MSLRCYPFEQDAVSLAVTGFLGRCLVMSLSQAPMCKLLQDVSGGGIGAGMASDGGGIGIAAHCGLQRTTPQLSTELGSSREPDPAEAH